MKKEIILFALLLIFLVDVSKAQEKATVDARFDFFLTLPANKDLGQKFDFGAGAIIGAAIFLPEIKTYFTPQVGFDFMPARPVGNDDTYRESIFFTNFGLEAMYQLYELDNYKLSPFIAISSRKVIDRYLVANGNIVSTNRGTDFEYDKLPPLFSTSAIALNFGLENRFNDTWFIRLSYELYQPKVNADLSNSYDDIDNEIFDPLTQKLNLTTIKIGIGAYFW
ncbi:hypothetical protein ACD591_20935 [Rufibacter glacialis]|uniref:PorT family protein n=1 Tax=Rufibacter glacialis TaxID=1259555 RepID=A0A5M8Q679_9BACT|nr:hypothetical protein [Rufibacter glacialis]KAA6430310.1 hypothetical protein FOE74_21100 [Rufibacter glacialis]GGK88195.1 hypothetical protein GCM10011405_39950 [Rufibacter glacialis]